MSDQTTGTEPRPLRRIVVGMDGSANASVALQWSVDEAAVHGADVEALVAWSYLDQHHPDGSDRFDAEYGGADAEAALAAWVTDAVGTGAAVGQQAVCDLPARALLEASDGADLVVVGARGKTLLRQAVPRPPATRRLARGA
jgi:nucleotide-binding universal stress UspA family protein